MTDTRHYGPEDFVIAEETAARAAQKAAAATTMKDLPFVIVYIAIFTIIMYGMTNTDKLIPLLHHH